MLTKLQKRNRPGFTIIEVLIVLAIGGLIMLVVFLAVPALQRNARNNQYRNEASRLLGAYNEISANNAGAVLTAADRAAVLAAANTRNITSLVIEAQNGASAASLTQAVIRTGARCTAANAATTPAGATRQVVILFFVETSDAAAPQVQCQEA